MFLKPLDAENAVRAHSAQRAFPVRNMIAPPTNCGWIDTLDTFLQPRR